MKERPLSRRVLSWLWQYTVLFALICFVTTACMLLFLHQMEAQLGFALTKEQVGDAAALTFFNVILLSLLCTLIDMVRRQFQVERPIQHICAAAERVMQGDLTVRIPKEPYIDEDEGYNVIIDYFNRMAGELSSTETLRTDFVANVSHELKTPLAVMQNYATLLAQPDLPEEKCIEYAHIIADSSRGLANMMTNILKLNKLENQKIYPATTTFDLGEQLCECLLGFEDAWEKKGLELDTDLAEDVRVTADPELLSLVWNNLFSNAIKFTGEGGRIGLRLTREDGMAVVSVSDTGCGIRPEEGKHIFDKFYQGDTSHATRGNGLGLALVKRVVDITGGSIAVQSEVGRGSTFTVRLACKPGQPKQEEQHGNEG